MSDTESNKTLEECVMQLTLPGWFASVGHVFESPRIHVRNSFTIDQTIVLEDFETLIKTVAVNLTDPDLLEICKNFEGYYLPRNEHGEARRIRNDKACRYEHKSGCSGFNGFRRQRYEINLICIQSAIVSVSDIKG